MKNPVKPIDTKAFNAKQKSRLPKKTVLTIAPSETPIEAFENADNDSTELAKDGKSNGLRPKNSLFRHEELPKSLAPEAALVLACKVMGVALRSRTYGTFMEAGDSSEDEIQMLLDDLEDTHSSTFAGANQVLRLQSLLRQLNEGELVVRGNSDAIPDEDASRILSNSIHAVVASQCHRLRFDDAVEIASKRAIYQLAYGLTHEINNPLANIAARAQQMIAEAGSESNRRSLATILDQSMRAHEMLSEMMRVVKPSEIRMRVEDIVALVRQAIELQEKQWSHAKVPCTLRVAAKPLYGSVDKAALLEAICSLLQNAFQVCHPNDRIDVVCEELAPIHPDFGPRSLLMEAEQQSTPRIRIAIRDTGPGMSCEAVQCAWDLYFSGREHGRGLGISLANVRRTIDAHGGFVWLQSKQNAGCTVEIRLPLWPEPPKRQNAFLL